MLARNKTTLDRLRKHLAVYRRVLPSLDLKRRQLSAELTAARARLAASRRELEGAVESAAARLPMAANEQIALSGLLRLKGVRLAEERHLGLALPRIEGVDWEVAPYSRLTKPHWVDPLLAELRTIAELRLGQQVLYERMRRLQVGLTRTIQRINLFDRLLIPRTERDVRRIRVALADAERDAMVRAKIAKARHGKPIPSPSLEGEGASS
jgi:V/A-type H+-transporting ATPase subunit D